MKTRKTKRTAGERRFRALAKKADWSSHHLQHLQERMQSAAEAERRVRDIYIMQIITEAIERLRP